MEQPDMRTNNPATDAVRDPTAPPSTAAGAAGGAGDPSQGISDRARDIAGATREKLADVGSTVRDRAGTMKDTLADAFESGADKLRGRSPIPGAGGVALAGETGGAAVAVSRDGRVAHVSDQVADGMQATAAWLRDADLDRLKESIEAQVKEHPGRTLLIAVGLGYLLGKALRK